MAIKSKNILDSKKRDKILPYGCQWIDDDDIQSVIQVLRSDWITTGPKVDEFERTFAEFVGAKHAVAVSSGTAALHAAMFALGIGHGDEVIVPAMTFAATANCVVFQGGTPVFADVDADSLLIDPSYVEKKITKNTKAVIAMDYAGQPCDYDALRKISNKHNLVLVADACHAIGGSYKGEPVGSLADLNTFSFHPVKHITTGEGGMITTNNSEFVKRMRIFRNHGITTDYRQRAEQESWFYEMVDLGYNYRMTDFQCALGMNQLKKLSGWVKRRQEIAVFYDKAFSGLFAVEPLIVRNDVTHAYHLYIVRIDTDKLNTDRSAVFSILRDKGIGVNVHYIPVHLHPYYRSRFGTEIGQCPNAESVYERILSLPIFPKMSDRDVMVVINAVTETVNDLKKLK